MTRNGQILRLRRHPDARLGRWKLLPAMLLGYVGLLLGPAVAGVLAAVNALSLRRFGLAASMLLLGALSWVACGMAAVLVAKARAEERALLSAFPAYAAYRTRTRRFLPGLY